MHSRSEHSKAMACHGNHDGGRCDVSIERFISVRYPYFMHGLSEASEVRQHVTSEFACSYTLANVAYVCRIVVALFVQCVNCEPCNTNSAFMAGSIHCCGIKPTLTSVLPYIVSLTSGYLHTGTTTCGK